MEEHKHRQFLFYPGRPHQVQQDVLSIDVNGFLADLHLAQRHFDAALRAFQHLARLFRFHLLHRLAAAGVQRVEKGADIALCGRLAEIDSFFGHGVSW